MRTAVSVEKRVGVTLWFLATTAEYRTLAHLFGIGRSTVCNIVQETLKAIVSVLMRQYITFPNGSGLQDVIEGFSERFGVPQCAGAIDGSHIPVTPPALDPTDYYNRKGWYSMILQAVVDHNYLFRDICTGWPGSVHDARVFGNSKLYRLAEAGVILGKEDPRDIEGCRISPYSIGDSAYPLLSWLMKPFVHGSEMSDSQKIFSYRLSSARIVVENAFGRLKARWRRLRKTKDVATCNAPSIIAACCVLHNICEIHGEGLDEAWQNEQDESTAFLQPAGQLNGEEGLEGAASIRAALARYFVNDH